ncbi:serine/threonine-protein phosphatase 7 long form-like protein [Gossypium australe]|uniref:Serine/threonine-protein phosphatase 7 long form-like protein n=1 Tax=Gossypium australe TaxID=47621 RepID=A0A5B6W1E1_9ROSI|nr:serine/threonine-protein phosphatase 7 long form-like protein [Gossypium australe]
MATGDSYVPPLMWRGNYYIARRSSTTGLSIEGEAVTGLGKLPDPVPLDEEGPFTHIKFNWLKENFEHLPNRPTQMDIIYAARVFILLLIGGILLPDVNQNRVSLMYLPLLEDLEITGRFS